MSGVLVFVARADGAGDLRRTGRVLREGLVLGLGFGVAAWIVLRSEEHTSELQSLMRISYAVFCLKKKKQTTTKQSSYKPTILKSILNRYNHYEQKKITCHTETMQR